MGILAISIKCHLFCCLILPLSNKNHQGDCFVTLGVCIPFLIKILRKDLVFLLQTLDTKLSRVLAAVGSSGNLSHSLMVLGRNENCLVCTEFGTGVVCTAGCGLDADGLGVIEVC